MAKIRIPSDPEISPAVRTRADVNHLKAIALESGMVSFFERAR